MAACERCGGPVDALRDPVRIVDGQLRGVCRPCRRAGEASPTTQAIACSGCGRPLERHLARPALVAGRFLLRCEACIAAPPAPPEPAAPAPPPPPPPPRRPRRRLAAPAMAAAATVAVAVVLAVAPSAPGTRRTMARAEAIPGSQADAGLEDDEVPGPVLLPLPGNVADAVWVHPLPGPDRTMPPVGGGQFGADRPGDRPRWCHGGHCGIDLYQPRGTPIFAVRDGVVLRKVWSPRARSGNYVELLHADGITTAYMHLDRLAAIEVGEHVTAGDVVGTLGRSGIKDSEAHLHLALKQDGPRGAQHLDPEPILRTAVLRSMPESFALSPKPY